MDLSKFFNDLSSSLASLLPDIGKIINDSLKFIFLPIFDVIKFPFHFINIDSHFSSNFEKILYDFIDIPFKNGSLGLIGWLFNGWSVLSFVIITGFIVINFRHLYNLTAFILTKIPALGFKR